jgi:hypothetical protein
MTPTTVWEYIQVEEEGENLDPRPGLYWTLVSKPDPNGLYQPHPNEVVTSPYFEIERLRIHGRGTNTYLLSYYFYRNYSR